MAEQHCAFCNKAFAGRSNQLYCRRSCRKNAENRRALLAAWVVKIEAYDREVLKLSKQAQVLGLGMQIELLRIRRSAAAKQACSLASSLESSLLSSPELVRRLGKLNLDIHFKQTEE